MPRSVEGRLRRIAVLRARAASSQPNYLPTCTIPHPVSGKPCGRPTARAARKGLNAFTCRYHQLHRQRHGSAWCKSPTAATLKPYIKAALRYVESHSKDPYVTSALSGVRSLLDGAG